MRIVYSDPLEELKVLIEQAKKDAKRVSHISMTKRELRACLSHAKAAQLFPNFMNQRQIALHRLQTQLDGIKPMIDGDALNADQKQTLFDRMSSIEERMQIVKDEVPNELSEGGVTIRVTLT